MQSFERILVPTDFSEHGKAALAEAVDIARSCGAELHLLHVVEKSKAARNELNGDQEATRSQRASLNALLPPEGEMDGRIVVELRIGSPHDEIVGYAAQANADLIVMGTHGRTGVARVLLGSVTERVLRNAPCPVLAIRRADGEPSEADRLASQPTLEEAAEDETQLPGPDVDLIRRADAMRATDIHIDPASDGQYRVRLRVDGRIIHYCFLDRDIAEHLTQQFKMLASLDIADPFHPQEGRLRLPSSLGDLEVRLTAAPVLGGEAVALRLFAREKVFHPLQSLGFSGAALTNVHEMLERRDGIVLVIGPAGAGKTTTVYSMLEVLSHDSCNIVSIEDPVEFPVTFVRQMSVDERHGLTMSSGLKTTLRMDPDIVFLGEIRDIEAADIAMRAASSGKNVFCTLHTRDAASTVTAIRDLHIDNRSLAGNLTGIISQRLLRRLCPECRELHPIRQQDRELMLAHGVEPPERVATSTGCDACRGTGFYERTGLFEVVAADDELRAAIARGDSEESIRELIRSQQTPGLLADALGKVRDHATSIAEAMEVRWL